MVHQQKPSTANHVKQPLAKKLKHSSDSESDAPSDEEGKYSDEENDNISKINKANHSKESKPKNKFNIWSSVMQDEVKFILNVLCNMKHIIHEFNSNY